MLRSIKASPVNPQAARRDAPVQCAVCGREVTRASRQQKYCSRRCRQQAHYEKSVAEGRFDPLLSPSTALPTKPPKKSNGVNGLQAAKSASTLRIYASRRVIEAELIAGRDWTAVASPDGVVCLVASGLRRRP